MGFIREDKYAINLSSQSKHYDAKNVDKDIFLLKDDF